MALKDLNFKFLVEPEASLVCVICHEIAWNPKQQEDCGQLFCEDCWEKTGPPKPCAFCRKENPNYFNDLRSHRSIKALMVACVQGEGECKWTGHLEDLRHHITKDCEYTLIYCTNHCQGKDNALTKLPRWNLKDHLRNQCPLRRYTCKFCKEKGTYLTITSTHHGVCPLKKCACPNTECKEVMARHLLQFHTQVCQHSKVPCKYAVLGCGVEKSRKEMVQHEEDGARHLGLALNAALKSKTDEESRPLVQHVFQVPNFTTSSKAKQIYIGNCFISSEGYQMEIKVRLNSYDPNSGESYVSTCLTLYRGETNSHNVLFSGTVTFELLNQLEDSDHYVKTKNAHCSDPDVSLYMFTFPKFISHSELFQVHESNISYLTNDTLYFRASVTLDNHKPWLVCTLNLTQN